jgi:hypothetical protein
MDAINDLMGFPRNRGKETMYPQVDVIMRSSVHAPGYPAVNVTDNPNTSRGGYHNNYIVRGPGASPTAANIEFHEQGHAYFFPKFGGETESNVNLLQPAMLHRKFGYSIDAAHAGSLGSSSAHRTLDNTAVAWMTVFNFSPRNVPMADGEKAYQHKGHAKFMDIARLFGWEGMDAYWRSFMEDDANGVAYTTGTDALLLRLSRGVGRDIRPLFHFWGIFPQNQESLRTALAAAGVQPSHDIYLLLKRYRTLVPADNTAFRSFALGWWGKQPSIGGYWEEREHARQWDTTPLYGAGDQQRSEATNPGEIFNENSAAEIRARVDQIIAIYFPDDHAAWTALYPGHNLADPDGDTDRDGISNRDERIWGLDPTRATNGHAMISSLNIPAGTFSYTRRNPSLTGLRHRIEWCDDLGATWHEDTGALQIAGPADASGRQSVAVTLSPALRALPRLFIRLAAAE